MKILITVKLERKRSQTEKLNLSVSFENFETNPYILRLPNFQTTNIENKNPCLA